MDSLRLVLLAGLLGHKLVWEYMRLREARRAAGGQAPAAPRPALPLAQRVLKLGKTLVLAALVIQTAFLNILPIAAEPGALRAIGFGIFALGLALAVAGRLQLGQNWANIEDSQSRDGQRLVSRGVYHYIRHPIYTGDILLLVGLELALNSWLALGILLPIVVVGRQAAAEEQVLTKAIEGYADYRRRTKSFIPFVF